MKKITIYGMACILVMLFTNTHAQLKIDDYNNVGIGTETPWSSTKLHVLGDSYLQGKVYIGGTDAYFFRDYDNRIATTDMFYVQASSPATYLYSTNTYLGNSSGDYIHLRGNVMKGNSWYMESDGLRLGSASSPGSWKLYIDGYAYVSDYLRADGGIHVGGSSDPGTDNLIVDGSVSIGGAISSYKLDVEGSIWASGTIQSSDIRYKEEIKDMNPTEDNYSDILKLKPVSYKMKRPKNMKLKEGIRMDTILALDSLSNDSVFEVFYSNRKQYEYYDKTKFGFIAQDVQKIFPEIVYENNEGYLGIDYIALIPMMIAALKEQQDEIEAQKQEMNAMKEELIKIKGKENKKIE